MRALGFSLPLVRGDRRKNDMNVIQTIEAENIAKFNETKKIPDFRPGDTLKVGVKVVEGERTRAWRSGVPRGLNASTGASGWRARA